MNAFVHIILISPCFISSKVGTVGLGLMGHGIALVSAQAGYQVIAVEAKPDALEMGKKRITSSLNRILSKVGWDFFVWLSFI